MTTREDIASACTSYATSAVGFTSHIDLIAIGSGILLLARLVKDVPEAFKVIRNHFKKQKKVKRNVKGKR